MRKVQALTTVAILITAACALAATDDAADIFTYVFDTAAPSAEPYAPEAVSARTGWIALEQDKTAHEFAGDAVLRNDRLVLAIRKGGQGAEVYVRTPAGQFVRRVLIAPSPGAGHTLARPSAFEITENTPGAVALRATYGTDKDNKLWLDYRLVTGQVYVQVDPGEGTSAVDVAVPTEWVVVPDFFADDLVYSAAATTRSRIPLPAENFFLHLVEGGDTVVTCVWPSNRQTASALVSATDHTKAITGSRIASFENNPIWVAFLEAPGAWHKTTLPDDTQAEPADLDWTPPFPADWRADFRGRSELARSHNFPQDRAAADAGQPHGPCWFQDGRAYVQHPQGTLGGGNAFTPVEVIVYPIDRTQATPLNVYCLVDIMRSTLGVGACQYVLDIEGLDAQSTPTPAKVADWVEKQFQKQRDTRYADAIRERTAAMVEHVAHADQRIGQYAEFARTARELSAELDQRDVARILDDLDLAIARFEQLREAPAAVRVLAERLTGLIGQPEAYDACRHIAADLRALGHAQDRTLSSCRMNVRRLNRLCQVLLEDDAGTQEIIRPLLDQTQRVLQ